VATGIAKVAARQMVAGVADAGGVGGTRWRTWAAVVNPGDTPVDVTLTYRHGAGSEAATRSLAPGEMASWDDVVGDLFGVPESAGSLDVDAAAPVAVSTRTYNDAATGTFGQYLPGVESDDALPLGGRAVMAPLAANEAFRTNVGFVNITDESKIALITLVGPEGTVRGETVDVIVGPRAWVQANGIFSAAGAGDCDACSAEITVIGGGGGLWAYASVVDNGSGDPTTVPMVVVE
jgi:hypothetical protein